MQGKPAFVNQAVEGKIRAVTVFRRLIVKARRKAVPAVRGKIFPVVLSSRYIAEIVEHKFGDALPFKLQVILARYKSQDIIADSLVGDAVQRLLHADEVMLCIAAYILQHDRID